MSKTFCVIESGLFQPLAHRLADQGNRVLYFRDWRQSFPTANDLTIGQGYNFECIRSLWEHIDEIDVFVFPDIGFGDLQQYLQSEGRACFGSGVSEQFEQYRVEAKQIMEECGLSVNPFEVVTGTKALRAHLEKHDDVFVKLSLARGVTESFHSESYRLVKVKLDEIEHKLGGMAESQEWIVEQPIPSIGEVGYDGITINGEFWKTGIAGVEKKDCGYFGAVKPYGDLPKACTTVNAALAPQFKEWSYCGWWSTEIRPGKDGKPYLIDPTCRMASPAGESYLDLIENWADIIEAGSRGEMVQPKWNGKFAAQAVLSCDIAKTQWVPIFIDPKVRQSVHLYHSAKIDGQEYVIPTDALMPEIGSAVGIGNTPFEAMNKCQKICDKIEAYGMTHKCNVLDDARKELSKFMPL